jgi:hypothetical protein
MNPGYVSSVIMIITLILCSSGWKQSLVRGISHSTILLFFVLWVVSSYFSIPISNSLQVVPVFFLAIAVLILCFFRIDSGYIRFHVISVGLLVGSLYFFLSHMLVLEPVYRFYLPFIQIPLSLGLIIILLYSRPILQVTACSLALLVGHTLVQWYSTPAYSLILGNKIFQDHWWMMIFAVRSGSEVWRFLCSACLSMVHIWNERRRG